METRDGIVRCAAAGCEKGAVVLVPPDRFPRLRLERAPEGSLALCGEHATDLLIEGRARNIAAS